MATHFHNFAGKLHGKKVKCVFWDLKHFDTKPHIVPTPEDLQSVTRGSKSYHQRYRDWPRRNPKSTMIEYMRDLIRKGEIDLVYEGGWSYDGTSYYSDGSVSYCYEDD